MQVTQEAIAQQRSLDTDAETGGRLVVGWDGSGAGEAAVRWALDRAEASSAPVVVVHVVEPGIAHRDEDGLAAVLDRAAVSHPALAVTSRIIEGAVVPALTGALDGPGDLLVIGTRRPGDRRDGTGREAKESRSASIAAALGARLVVVPDVDLHLRQGVVTGVRDEEDAGRLGAVAGRESERCGREVTVIHAVGADGGRTGDAALLGTARAAAGADGRVVRSRSVDRDPVEALLDAAHDAALLVIGSSTHPRLSPVVHDVLLHVNAPTLVVPAEPRAGGAGAREKETAMTDASETAVRSPIRMMDERECWARLQQEELGRLAVTLRGETEIFPVNYLAQQGRILIRTAPGTKLAGVLMTGRVTFEIDGYDDETAWSVVVKGSAEEVPMRTTELQVRTVPTPWVDTLKDAVIEITPDTVTGRRFTRAGA